MNQIALGKKILELRNKKALTQKELAEQCNLSLRTIQRIESGEVTPRSHTTKTLFSVLDYDIDNLLPNSNKESNITNSIEKWFQKFLKNVLKLFNLKTNTMKKLSVLSFILILLTVSIFLTSNKINAQKIEGWHLAGNKPNSYTSGLDEKEFQTGNSSAFLESKDPKTKGFGTLMQMCNAKEYIGKRVKMTASIKSKNVNDWAGMWLRIDSNNSKKLLGFDNMEKRPIKGNTEWTIYEIILDVPEESSTLNYGFLLSGTGKIWFDDIKFTIVDATEELTVNNEIPKKPLNLNFDK